MTILVDADACPVRKIIVHLAKERQIPVTMITDTAHHIEDDYSTVITVDKSTDSVDFKLISILTSADIVVTQDYGLAAMVLGKGARAINQNGLVYTDSNIDKLLMERHLGAKIRRSARKGGKIGGAVGHKTKPGAKRTKEDDVQFGVEFGKLMDMR